MLYVNVTFRGLANFNGMNMQAAVVTNFRR